MASPGKCYEFEKLTMIKPRFSIVLPTRDRRREFPLSLRSALSQTADDLEIIVSNNGHDDSPKDIVRELNDPRVRYFRTPGDLGMVASWNFAVSHARGEWISFLSDDDAASSHLLAYVKRAIEITDQPMVTWLTWNYHSAHSPDPYIKNAFVTHPFSGRIQVISSQEALATAFSFREDNGLPVVLNTFCRRDLFQTLHREFGQVFLAPAPDYTTCAALLGITKSFAHINVPLRFAGSGAGSPHESEDHFSSFAEGLGEENRGQYAPIPLLSPVNIVPESLFRVRTLMPKTVGNVEIDLTGYITYYSDRVAKLKRRGFSMREEEQLLDEFLEMQPFTVRKAWRRRLHRRNIRYRLREIVRASVLRLPIPVGLAFAREVVWGDKKGFHDINGAIEYLDQHIVSAPR